MIKYWNVKIKINDNILLNDIKKKNVKNVKNAYKTVADNGRHRVFPQDPLNQ